MKDEIKEILDRLKNNDFERDYNDGSYYKELYLGEIDILLDYITNLQEEKDSIDDYARHLHNENKILQEENKGLKKTCLDLTSKCGSLKLVKEAALEYIDKNRAGFIKPMNWLELRNILQGENNNE